MIKKNAWLCTIMGEKILFMFFFPFYYQHGSSGWNSDAGSKGITEKVTPSILFEEFYTTFSGNMAKEELANGFQQLHSNDNLMIVFETFQDFEVPDEVLWEKLLVEFKTLYVFSKLSATSKDYQR